MSDRFDELFASSKYEKSEISERAKDIFMSGAMQCFSIIVESNDTQVLVELDNEFHAELKKSGIL